MRWTEMPIAEYWDTRPLFAERQVVRRFHNCMVSSATREARPVLLLLEYGRHKVTVCEYESADEREEDIEYLLSLPPRGGATGSAVPVVPRSTPPFRFARDAKPFPIEE